jgi:hypothetical protein
MVCQVIADSLDEGVRTDAIIIVFNAFDLVPHDKLLMKITATGVDLSCMGKGIFLRTFEES